MALRLLYSDGSLYRAYRVLRSKYSHGGLYKADMLWLMYNGGGLY